MELARNLPALVAQLKALREDMERKSKLYDALLQNAGAGQEPTTRPNATSDTSSAFDLSQSGMRGSVFTPFANSLLDPRASQMTLEDLSALDAALDESHYSNTLVSRQSSIMMRQQQHRGQQRRSQQRPSYGLGYTGTGRAGPDAYTVIWVSGECGISLRNFSRKDNKVGAQIAVLQHADGVTTGISNCRLGDQLVSINDDRVDTLKFREIVEKLKTTKRPISLGFRTNQNVQTSPRATTSPSSAGFSNTNGGSGRSSNLFRGGSLRSKKKASPSSSFEDRHSVSGASHSNLNALEDYESSDVVHETIEHLGYGDSVSSQLTRSSSGEANALADRGTTTSMMSSTSTLSEDVEVWCREQEEMHSDIIVLLTETVMRCEKLQQENMDQLQNLMQLSAGSPSPSDRSSVASSYAGTENAGKDSQAEEVDAVVPSTASPASSPRA